MNKPSSVFLAVAVSGATTIALAAILVLPLRAQAYAIGPVAPGAMSSGSIDSYDFGNSFQNLVSPFTNFFNNIKNVGGSTFSVGGGSIAPGVTINISAQPYVAQFEAWFYRVTGIHIDGYVVIAIRFFGWLFGVLDGIVVWLANTLKGNIK